MEQKLKVLQRVACELNAAGGVWGVGASLLMYFHGMSDHFNDIDLVVSEADVEKVDALLASMGEKCARGPSGVYTTRYFYEYVIEGVELDVMGGFGICNEGVSYRYEFGPAALAGTRMVNDEPVPLIALEDWYLLYQLMPQRQAKVLLLEQHLRQPGCLNIAHLQALLQAELPQAVRQRVNQLLGFIHEREEAL